ncbi:MAG: BadF/BadG/BcrA/BcrD ATPase family protein [Rhodothermales bacterium]|nr:BadF/BadG/BcrA/BcrD ATPase family protein [Rhodothermales bacterium]
MKDESQTYIGIDAGGSRLRLIGTNGARRVSFEAAGVNLWRDGLDAAEERLRKAITRAGKELGGESLSVVAGIAGAMDRAGAAELSRRLVDGEAGLDIRGVTVLSDVQLAHYAAFGKSAGVTVVIGTGSVVFTRSADATERIWGGWGYLLGDEGSGHAIGIALLRHLAEQTDNEQTTPLAELLQRNPGEDFRTALLRRTYGEGAIQNLAPAVISMAKSESDAALALVDQQATLLVGQILHALSAHGDVPRRVAFTGGLSRNDYYLALLQKKLAEAWGDFETFRATREPVEEAVRMAEASRR